MGLILNLELRCGLHKNFLTTKEAYKSNGWGKWKSIAIKTYNLFLILYQKKF